MNNNVFYNQWTNNSGSPLANNDWLEIHHAAKLNERQLFVESHLSDKIQTIVDLGCGTGLWLDCYNSIAPNNISFIGVDYDKDSITKAMNRSKHWERNVSFFQGDVINNNFDIPSAELYLLYNILSYIPEYDVLDLLTRIIKVKPNKAKIVIRQYDGAAIRFGPMSTEDRIEIDTSLHSSVAYSKHFNHYGMDNIFEVINNLNCLTKHITFELYEKKSPYSPNTMKYIKNMLHWTQNYLSDSSAEKLVMWKEKYLKDQAPPSYFTEVDMIATLS